MSVDVKICEELIQKLVEFRRGVKGEGDLQVISAAISVVEENLKALESED